MKMTGKWLIVSGKALFAVLLWFFVVLPPAIACAQSDWFKKGLDLLGTVPQTEMAPAAMTSEEIAAGLKEALRVGSETVTGNLGKLDGFNADPHIHIPLPKKFEKVRSALQSVGMAGMMNDLELKLNRAAEQATPQAKQLFWESIDAMTLDDVMGIYQGPQDAATRYFEGRMSAPLAEAMRPVVAQSLQEVGAIQAYDAVMGEYKAIPFVPDVKADLTGYVVDEGMAGIFHYLAIEEAAIRANPVKRTTEILQKVFGSQ
jgi:hypothetical protein